MSPVEAGVRPVESETPTSSRSRFFSERRYSTTALSFQTSLPEVLRSLNRPATFPPPLSEKPQLPIRVEARAPPMKMADSQPLTRAHPEVFSGIARVVMETTPATALAP